MIKKIFDMDAKRPNGAPDLLPSDVTDAERYVFDCDDDGNSDRELAVNVALAAERPLLVLGKSGQGKSSLATAVAWRMGWRFLRTFVTARTTAEDLLWQVDAVERLADAQLGKPKPNIRFYLSPGPLWWALNPRQARFRGFADGAPLAEQKVKPAKPPGSPDLDARFDGRRAVLLIDEIDKADPDLPNALLGPLGNWRFAVRPTEDEVTLADGLPRPLVVMTSNDERALPAAFVRRCIVVRLKEAEEDDLFDIAKSHFKDREGVDDDLLRRIAQRAAAEEDEEGKVAVSPAEVLDAVKACLDLGITDEPRFGTLLDYALSKQPARD